MESVGDILTSIYVYALAMVRLLAVFVMLPIFQKAVFPGMLRNSIAISLTMMVFPVIDVSNAAEVLSSVQMIFAVVIKEVVLGILIGFGLSSIFYALESAGFFIDNQRGSSMASSVDPLTGSQTSPLGIFLTQVITVYLFVSGGFLLLLGAIYQSYLIFPVLEFFPTLDFSHTRAFLGILDHIMGLAILIAAPAMIAMFLSEFGLGLVSRFAPQLNVFFLAMPVKSAVGILMLILYIGFLPLLWDREFASAFSHVDLLQSLFE